MEYFNFRCKIQLESLYNGGTSVADPAKSNDNNRHLGAHNASKPMVTTESVCQQVRKPEKFLV